MIPSQVVKKIYNDFDNTEKAFKKQIAVITIV